MRDEEIEPGKFMPELVFLDDRVVIRGIEPLDLVDDREEVLDREEIVTLEELDPELRLLPLLFFDDEPEDEALRFCLACDVDP